jgi:hypothetical protein
MAIPSINVTVPNYSPGILEVGQNLLLVELLQRVLFGFYYRRQILSLLIVSNLGSLAMLNRLQHTRV